MPVTFWKKKSLLWQLLIAIQIVQVRYEIIQARNLN
jgi:hypothetical protein